MTTTRARNRRSRATTFALTVLMVGAAQAGALVATTSASAVTVLSTALHERVPSFIGSVTLGGINTSRLRDITFTVQPKPGATATAVSATYGANYLVASGRVDAGAGTVTIPVFGLYEHYTNTVALRVRDGRTTNLNATLTTDAWNGPFSAAGRESITPRNAAVRLDYSYMLLKSGDVGPMILDIDGNVRWAGLTAYHSPGGYLWGNDIYFDDGQFYCCGSHIYKVGLDGTVSTVADYSDQGVWGFHHNYDPGKRGLLVEVNLNDATDGGASHVESTIFEINPSGAIIDRWNISKILRDAMGPSDASTFVYDGWDYFHNNAATYWKAQNTLVVSSRENFVIGIGYDDKKIKWILGDTSKEWYTYASLRRYALNLLPGSLPGGSIAPVGEHAVSITRTGELMLFDNGEPSFMGADPAGPNRGYSAPRRYSINLRKMTAVETWRYDHGQTLDSNICSSVYESGRSLIVDYANTSSGLHFVGLGAGDQVGFEYRWDGGCGNGWNLRPIDLANVRY
jgi:hypothetical protein